MPRAKMGKLINEYFRPTIQYAIENRIKPLCDGLWAIANHEANKGSTNTIKCVSWIQGLNIKQRSTKHENSNGSLSGARLFSAVSFHALQRIKEKKMIIRNWLIPACSKPSDNLCHKSITLMLT